MTSQSLNPKLESDLDGVSKQFIMKLRLNYLSTERRLIMAEKTNERPQNPKIKEAREHMYAARKICIRLQNPFYQKVPGNINVLPEKNFYLVCAASWMRLSNILKKKNKKFFHFYLVLKGVLFIQYALLIFGG